MAGLRLSPAFQTVTVAASQSAQVEVEFSNHASSSATLNFSLANIMATDIFGRLQFNAPLPQSITPARSDISIIEPASITLNPGDTATITTTFNTAKLKDGTNNFLLLAEVNTPRAQSNNNQQLKQYLGASIAVNHSPNAIIGLELTELGWDQFPIKFNLPTSFTLTLKNTGNANSTPRGLVLIKNQFNQELSRGSINDTSQAIIPGSQRLIKADLQPLQRFVPIALSRIEIHGYDATKQSPFSVTEHFLYIHPLSLVVFLLPLASVFIASLLKKRR